MAATVAALAVSGIWAAAAQASDQLAYVANEQAGTITQVDLATGTLGTPIEVGSQPDALAINPAGSTAYVADFGSSEVVPVALATGKVGAPIALSDHPNAIAIAPSGRTAYVISDNGREWPIALSSGHVGNPSLIPTNSDAIAVAPNGATAYITDVADATISPFSLTGGGLGEPINLDAPTPDGIAISADGSTAYVASNSGGTITPVDLATGAAGTPIQAGIEPTSVALSPDGGTAYVTNFSTGQLTPIALASGTAGTPISVGAEPSAIAMVPAGGITSVGGGGSSGGGGGNSGGGGGTAKVTLGNQQLTLTVSGGVTGGAAQACRARGATLRVRLTRRTLRHGARLRLRYVTFSLGKQVRRAKRLPVTVRLKVRGLRPGMHILKVRVVYHELLAAAARHHGKRRLAVTITRTLRARIKVC